MQAITADDRLARDEHECYALLGLPDGAVPEDVADVCEELERFLDLGRVPPALRPWARRQRQLAARARATLAGGHQRGPRQAGTAPVARGQAATRAERRRRAAQLHHASAAPRSIRDDARPMLLAFVAALAALALFLGGQRAWQAWQDRNQPAPQAAAPADHTGDFVPLDTARVADLQARLTANPGDTEALFELGERYFQAGRWQDTIDWFTKLVTLDPGHVHAYTDIGTASFNLARFDEARAAWSEALRLAPDDPQVHYNLGYLHAYGRPRDLEAAKREWERVLSLAPGTPLAATAQRDLAELQRQQNQPLAPGGRP